MNDLRSDALKRIRASDNQLIMKEHLIRLENDKCQSSNAMHYDYNQCAALKEHKPYFMDTNSAYYSTDQRTRQCNDPYAMSDSGGGGGSNNIIIGGNGNDKNNHTTHDGGGGGGYANDYDDSVSMNGDNSKDYLVTSSGGSSGNSEQNKSHRINAKRNKYTDYATNFDSGIRPRNLDEMQNDEHHQQRLVDDTNHDYRVNVTDDNNTDRCGSDDNRTNINVNYASSEDLNQTNTSEHDDKNLSGSDDESGGLFCFCFAPLPP